MSDWKEVRVTFIGDYEDPSMMFWKGDTFYAEVEEDEDNIKMHVLDQELPLEYYLIPKSKVEMRQVDYYTAEVTFRTAWMVRLPDDTEVTVDLGDKLNAGVVDDGTDTVDLLLHCLMKPVNQIKQVPKNILYIENKKVE